MKTLILQSNHPDTTFTTFYLERAKHMHKLQSDVIKLIKEGPIVTLGNFFSLLRILLLPFILIALKTEHNILALGLMVLAALTDALDGWAARHFNQISNLGKMIDPLADKITFGAIAYFLVMLREFPLWAVLVLIGRDMLIIAASIILIHRKRFIIPSTYLGKMAMFFLICSILSYTLWWNQVKLYFLLITIFFLVLSTIKYGMYYFEKEPLPIGSCGTENPNPANSFSTHIFKQ